MFKLAAGRSKVRTDLIRPLLPTEKELQRITLKPGGTMEVPVRFVISPQVKPGQKLHFPLEFKRLTPGRATMGGLTFTIEVAEGRLEGRLVSREGFVPKEGSVTIENIKQTNLRYEVTVSRSRNFSFPHVVPGPYRISAACGELVGRGSVFVEPNRVTTKVLPIEAVRRPVR